MRVKGDHQKLKMLYLVKIFSEETDDLHPLTMAEIIQKLAAYGMKYAQDGIAAALLTSRAAA